MPSLSQLSDLGLPEDNSRPVQTVLSKACLEKFNAGFTAVEAAQRAKEQRGILGRAETERMVTELVQAAKQSFGTALELMDWVYPLGRPMQFVDAIGKAQFLIHLGADSEFVEPIFADLQSRPVGRPHHRQAFVRAFEFMMLSKANTQGRATKRFCPCGAKAHCAKCEQNLKAGMRSLKKVLRKHAPDLVSKYDILHPDRAKKVNG